MRGQPAARRVAGCEAAPTSLGAVIAHQARDQGQNEGSIRPFSKGLHRDSLPSELETATALGCAARGLALCPASAHPLIPVLFRGAWGSAPLLQLLFGIDFHME